MLDMSQVLSGTQRLSSSWQKKFSIWVTSYQVFVMEQDGMCHESFVAAHDNL
jgi:hypothetical protein